MSSSRTNALELSNNGLQFATTQLSIILVLDSWQKGKPCSMWLAVTCNPQSLRVVGMNLSGLNTPGPIPSLIGNLTALLNLDLSFNKFTGGIPDSFANLRSLRTLGLRSNRLTGALPSFLSTLPLISLDLSNNLISGLLTNPFDPLCAIINLDNNCLAFSACAGAGPKKGQQSSSSDACKEACVGEACINPLEAVFTAASDYCSGTNQTVSQPGLFCVGGYPYVLDITQYTQNGQVFDNNGLPMPDSISTLSSLGALILNNANVGGSIPSSIARLRGLAILSLSSNTIQGSIPEVVSALSSLSFLDLHKNQLLSTIPVSLSSLSNLEVLDLSYNKIYGTIPGEILALTQLTRASLSHNQLAGEIPSAQLTNRLLLLGGLSLSSNYLSSLAYSPTSLTFSQCNFVSQSLADNCFRSAMITSPSANNCTLGSQKDLEYSCAAFCNALGERGTCGGQGYCYLADAGVPTCECFQGYTRSTNSAGTCVPDGAARPPPPPPTSSPAPVSYALGYNQTGPSAVPETYLNRWTRHLSRGYVNVNGAAAWNLLSISNWIAEANQFFPNTPLLGLPFSWDYVNSQGACRNCWALSVADSVGAALALRDAAYGAVKRVTPAVIQTCSLDNSSSGCLGGLPPNALDLTVAAGVRPSNRFTSHMTCTSHRADLAPYQVVMYERVKFSGWFGLLMVLSSQPAVVTIQASSSGFQSWTSNAEHSNVFQDPACYSGELDHSLLVVGYQFKSLTPYWVLRNSWGEDWGDSGYIRMAMFSPSYTANFTFSYLGTCGVYVYPAYYPIPAPPEGDPCYTGSFQQDGSSSPSMSPCGGGKCSPRADWGKYSYECECSSLQDFVAVNNTVTITLPDAGSGITQTCVPVDVCRLGYFNPCGVGTCLNNGKGDYNCICPLGFQEDTLKDGSKICSFLKAGSASPIPSTQNFTVPQEMSCYLVYVSFGLSQTQFLQLNPRVNCAKNLPVGTVVDVSNPTYPGCVTPYVVSRNDKSCKDIASKLGLLPSDIAKANPGLDCSFLIPFTLICAKLGDPPPLYPCLTQYPVSPKDTCETIISQWFKTSSPLDFYTLNPGIDCDKVASASSYGEESVCLALSDSGGQKCSRFYVTKKGETCLTLVKDKIFKSMNAITPASICRSWPIATSMRLCVP